MEELPRLPIFAIEGQDGSGHGTMQLAIENALLQQEEPFCVHLSAEPDDRRITGNFIRQLLKTKIPQENVFIWLWMADRQAHINELIHIFRKYENEQNDREVLFLSDRYYWSSVVYQGSLGNIGINKVLRLHSDFQRTPRPLAHIYPSLPPEEVSGRIKKRKSEGYKPHEVYDDDKFVNPLYQHYLQSIPLILQYGDPVIVLDTRKTPESIAQQAIPFIMALYKRWKNNNHDYLNLSSDPSLSCTSINEDESVINHVINMREEAFVLSYWNNIYWKCTHIGNALNLASDKIKKHAI